MKINLHGSISTRVLFLNHDSLINFSLSLSLYPKGKVIKEFSITARFSEILFCRFLWLISEYNFLEPLSLRMLKCGIRRLFFLFCFTQAITSSLKALPEIFDLDLADFKKNPRTLISVVTQEPGQSQDS